MTREEILKAAQFCVCGEREKSYGSPEDSFTAIAAYWTAYLRQLGVMQPHQELTPEDVALMMILLKIARQTGRGKVDNWIDIAGYAACGGEITTGVEET